MARIEIRDGIQYVIEPEGEWELGPVKEPERVPETVEEKLAKLEQQNLTLMDALADMYEELLALKEGGE